MRCATGPASSRKADSGRRRNEPPPSRISVPAVARRRCGAEVSLQNLAVDGRKVAAIVCSQHVSMALAMLFATGHRAMRAMTDAIRVTVSDGTALEDRRGPLPRGVMHNAVAQGRGGACRCGTRCLPSAPAIAPGQTARSISWRVLPASTISRPRSSASCTFAFGSSRS